MHPLGFIILCHVAISRSETVWHRAQWILHRSSRLTRPCACDFTSSWMATLSQSKPRQWYLLYPLTPCKLSNHNSIWHWCKESENIPDLARKHGQRMCTALMSVRSPTLRHYQCIQRTYESSAHQTPPENWSPHRCFGQTRSHMGCSCNIVETEPFNTRVLCMGGHGSNLWMQLVLQCWKKGLEAPMATST